uniref:Uncharacterized protein n=1 Tax=Anopheles atroparvus TaxID=41427 RepID=A0A182INR0_ANOAO
MLRRISVVMIRHEAVGLIVTSPVTSPTSLNSSWNSRSRQWAAYQRRQERSGSMSSSSSSSSTTSGSSVRSSVSLSASIEDEWMMSAPPVAPDAPPSALDAVPPVAAVDAIVIAMSPPSLLESTRGFPPSLPLSAGEAAMAGVVSGVTAAGVTAGTTGTAHQPIVRGLSLNSLPRASAFSATCRVL